jgi:predicted amidohydrolase YtcJ
VIARGDFVRGGAAAGLAALAAGPVSAADGPVVDTIVTNAKIATFDEKVPRATALAIYKGRIAVVGDDATLLRYQAPSTRMIDAKGKTLIPGLTDAQLSLVRTGLTYTAELRWDGVPSVADALRMLKVQAARTPAGQWVRVVGGWSPYQFAEKRLPTADELETAAGNVPAFVLLFDRAALLNRAGFRALGIAPTASGMLAGPPAAVRDALARLPRLGLADQETGTRLFMRELNRLGVTSCIDAGGEGLRYPDDYAAFAKLDRDKRITVRTAYSLAPAKAGEEIGAFLRFVGNTQPYTGDASYRQNGGGPVLLYAADDRADFAAPRPALGSGFAADFSSIVTLLAQHDWPFGVRAAFAESIDPLLATIERVNAKTPFNAPFWLVGAETIDDRAIARVAALKGGIVVTDRLAFQGEAFAERAGVSALHPAATVGKMLAAGVTVGLGTDGTRNASYNPWIALYWLVAQRTVGGLRTAVDAPLKREDALRAMTANGAWFSNETDVKGTIAPGRLADLAILSDDYFSVPDAQIPGITADLTMVGGAIIHAQSDFASLAPAALAPSPVWSPITVYGAARAPVIRG